VDPLHQRRVLYTTSHRGFKVEPLHQRRVLYTTSYRGFWVEPLRDGSRWNPLCWVEGRTPLKGLHDVPSTSWYRPSLHRFLISSSDQSQNHQPPAAVSGLWDLSGRTPLNLKSPQRLQDFVSYLIIRHNNICEIAYSERPLRLLLAFTHVGQLWPATCG